MLGNVINNSIIKNCYNLSSISANENSASRQIGGIAGGTNSVQISNCYNSGLISGNNSIGGIAGATNSVQISNCYNSGLISGDRFIGGISGAGSTNIDSCYNSANIVGNTKTGALIGNVNGGTIQNSYYLENKVTATSETILGVSVSSDELKLLYTNLGSAFKQDVSNVNDGYPILNWQ